MTEAQRIRCTHPTQSGRPCRAWAIRDTDPPRCAAHAGRPVGAPRGNRNAVQHGFYATLDLDPVDGELPIDTVIRDLALKQAQLSALIGDRLDLGDENEARELMRLLHLHGLNASRLGRLLRDRQVLAAKVNARLLRILGQALDRGGPEREVEL
jgi:hypothetical protein